MNDADALRNERFEIGEPLGRGGMGAVYRAFDRERKQVVALKHLLAQDPASIYRFKREFRALANVAHPNLVTLYDLVFVAGTWFITMELIDGTTFISYVRPNDPKVTAFVADVTHTQQGIDSRVTSTMQSPSFDAGGSRDPLAGGTAPLPPVDLERLYPAALQLATAIRALHEMGHLHRDIKPSNILVAKDGRVVVLDFGVITQSAVGGTYLGDDAIAGTPSYMAPELDRAPPSEASDWYAFGVVLFQALAGQRPFRDGPRSIGGRRDSQLGLLLGTSLPPSLVALCIDLLHPDPAARPTGAEILRRLRGPNTTRPMTIPSDPTAMFVGRERELEALHRAWADSRAGTGVGVLLHGPSGVGKSALVDRFLEDLRRDGVVVLAGRCYEQESVPYKALDSLVDAIARHLLGLADDQVRGLLPEDIGALARAFRVLERIPEVSRVAQVSGMDESNRSELQRRAFAALGELLTRLAKQFLLILYIDDLQWGDADSAAFLARLLGPQGPHALFLAGYRSEHVESSALLPTLFSTLKARGEHRVRMIDVLPLPRAVLEDLAFDMLRERAPDGQELRARAITIAAEAKGSPYFVHELVRYATSHPASDEVPVSISAVLAARAARLTSAAQRLLQIVSLAGGRVGIGVAQTAADLGPHGGRAFVELRAGHFIKSTGAREDDWVEPYHDRVRETVQEALQPAEIQRVHLQIAKALEAVPGEGKEHIYALAYHWAEADPGDRQDHVYATNLIAGRTACESYAYRQAYWYFTRARQAAHQAGITLDAEAEVLMADVQARIGLSEAGLDQFRRALDRSRDPLLRASIRLGSGRIQLGWLDTAKSIDEAHAGLEELGLRQPRGTVAAWLSALGSFFIGLVRLVRCRSRSLPAGTERERKRLASQLYMLLGLSYYFHLEPENLLRTTLKMLPTAADLGPSRELVEWYMLAGGASAALRRPGIHAIVRQRAEHLATEIISDPVGVARTALYHAIYRDMVGDPLAAEIALARALDAHGPLFEPIDYYSCAAALAWNRLVRGHAAGAWAVIDLALAHDAAGGELNAVRGHSYRCYAAPILAMLGRLDEARAHAEQRERELVDVDRGARWRRSQQLGHAILFQYEADDLGPTFDDNVRSYQVLHLKSSRLPYTMLHGFIAIAYGRRRQLEGCAPSERPQRLHALERAVCAVRASTKGLPVLLGHLAVLDASYHNQIGKPGAARKRLADAERFAEATDNDWVRFEVTMERARFAITRDDVARARRHLDDAIALAHGQGWSARAARCDALRARITER